MPTEIADSDGESELNSPAKVEQFLPNHPAETQQSAASNDFGVHFSDFLSQEQQLHEEWRLRSPKLKQATNHVGLEPEDVSPAMGNQHARGEHPTGPVSTAVRDGAVQSEPAATETTPITSRKRRHTAQNNGDDAGQPDQLSQKRQRKSRAKTYGNNSDRRKLSQTQGPSDATGSTTHAWQLGVGHGDTPEHECCPFGLTEIREGPGTDMSMQPPPAATTRAIEEDESPRQRNRPRRVLSLLEESTPDAPREISTSRSSMGNYESINIDFRGTASGRDMGANPFGSLSQISSEDEVHDVDREKMTAQVSLDRLNTSALLRASILSPSEFTNDSGRWNGYDGVNGDGEHETAKRPRTIDPMALYNDLPNDTQLFPSSKDASRKGRTTVPRSSMSPAVETNGSSINRSLSDNGTVSAKLNAKKRGRKPKSQRLLSESPGRLQEDEEADITDELAIGLPKEQYKPRPSRSRAATNEMGPKPALPENATKEHEAEKDEQSSPVKQSTRELNLSDEAFIGLPKENYMARPSRSRSKRTVMDDADTTQQETVAAAGDVQISAVVLDEADATPVKNPKKAAKKTKIKRAKTSAWALLKKSQAMLSEGEDDVLWLETKPSEVKLDLPADIKREVHFERKEIPTTHTDSGRIKAAAREGIADENGLEAKQQDEDTKAASQSVSATAASAAVGDLIHEETKMTDTTHIVVDIPPQATSLTPVEPKKRGRKKKSLEVVKDHVVDLEGPSHASETPTEAGVSGLAESASATAAQPGAKKRGRKKKVTEVLTQREDVNDNTEHESDGPPSDENAYSGSRPGLAERDLNCPPPHPNFKSSTQAIDAPPPENENRLEDAATHVETPHKPSWAEEESAKGPTRHSPINPSGGKARYRVGLSKRAAIPSLLKIVRKDLGKLAEKEKPKRRRESPVPVEDED